MGQGKDSDLDLGFPICEALAFSATRSNYCRGVSKASDTLRPCLALECPRALRFVSWWQCGDSCSGAVCV